MSLLDALVTTETLSTGLLQQAKAGPKKFYADGKPLRSLLADLKFEKEGKSAPITKDTLQRAQMAWQRAKQTNDFESLSRNELRILASLKDVVAERAFIEHIAMLPEWPTRFIRNLVPTFHSLWKKSEMHLWLQQLLALRLSQFTGSNRRVSFWRDYRHYVIDQGAEKNLANEMVVNLRSISQIQEVYGLEFSDNALLQESIDLAAWYFAQGISNKGIEASKWKYLFGEILLQKRNSTGVLPQIIGALIAGVQSQAKSLTPNAYKEELIDFILTKSELKDPRMYRVNWQGVSADALEQFISWLSEEDLEFFFKLIIRQDPHSRKAFWLAYLNRIRASRVICCPKDIQRNYADFRVLEQKGRTYSSFSAGDVSAFLLDFGEYIVVEFSKSGNACFLYPKNKFLDSFGSIYQASGSVRDLKNGPFIYKQSHHQGWQLDLRQELAARGIRPGAS